MKMNIVCRQPDDEMPVRQCTRSRPWPCAGALLRLKRCVEAAISDHWHHASLGVAKGMLGTEGCGLCGGRWPTCSVARATAGVEDGAAASHPSCRCQILAFMRSGLLPSVAIKPAVAPSSLPTQPTILGATGRYYLACQWAVEAPRDLRGRSALEASGC
jgi:hypothetical protein